VSDQTTTASAVGSAALLDLIRRHGLRTRAELIAATGLGRSTVGARLELLQEQGLIRDGSNATSTGGRPAARFEFNAEARVILAADVGASHARVAITDLDARPLAVRHSELDIALGPEKVIAWVCEKGLEMLAEVGRGHDQLAGVGIGLPGPVEHETGRPTSPPIMPGWHGADVPGLVAETFPVPVLVDNDVNIMALGEHATTWPQVQHLMFVKVATGIGSGIISDGALNRGAQGAAGDLGHIRVTSATDAVCRCGNTGCLEAIASGPAVAAQLRSSGLDVAGTEDVVARVRGGDAAAAAAVRQAGRDLGDVLAGCVSLLNPSVIVVGGLLAEAGETLLAGVREAVYARSLPLATQHLSIVHSTTGVDAAVIGAGVLVAQHVLSPQALDVAG